MKRLEVMRGKSGKVRLMSAGEILFLNVVQMEDGVVWEYSLQSQSELDT